MATILHIGREIKKGTREASRGSGGSNTYGPSTWEGHERGSSSRSKGQHPEIQMLSSGGDFRDTLLHVPRGPKIVQKGAQRGPKMAPNRCLET